MGAPKTAPHPWGSHLIHGSLGPPESAAQMAPQFGLTVFVELTVVTER